MYIEDSRVETASSCSQATDNDSQDNDQHQDLLNSGKQLCTACVRAEDKDTFISRMTCEMCFVVSVELGMSKEDLAIGPKGMGSENA